MLYIGRAEGPQPGRRRRSGENVERRVSRVDRPKGGPYNPPTADEAAPQGADETSETLEIAKKFEISKRVLTGSRVSNTTRLADDVER